MQKAADITEIYGAFFGCEINANINDKTYPYRRIPLAVNMINIDMNRMGKFIHPDTKMIYIIDNETNKSFAIYNSSIIFNSYGIREWVNSIPIDPLIDVDVIMYSQLVGL